ncbi:hypothetical protein [Hippea alviniae]|uniref:hypothetical protein n=1 Tax=Hippea alviniae TaxID=1279027 RepID=UPI0003B7B566|nr:hypothetical protein [Hippea alviniae]
MDKEALFWDYKEHSHTKELERIGLFFPQIGRDKETIIELYENLDRLNIPESNKKLIELYYDLIKKG